jgi:hypothetical protein
MSQKVQDIKQLNASSFLEQSLPLPQLPSYYYRNTDSEILTSSMDTAKAINYLRDHMQVEAIVGDYVDIAEKLQFNLHDRFYQAFPSRYDRIHLGNIPYVLSSYKVRPSVQY